MEIENVLSKEFANVCDWFVDNKLTIHFGEDKTKWILFSRDKNLPKLNPLSANPTKWPNTLKQFVSKLLTNFLSVFVHFVKLALKGLTQHTITIE